MKLHWSPKSPYVRKVMMCAIELGLVPRLRLVRNVAAMLKPNPAIMVDNPLSKIPTLVLEDGTVMIDSIVICEYLNSEGEGMLFPGADRQKWQSLVWHALGDGLLDVLILWRNERERATPLVNLMDAFELKTRATLKLLDRQAGALAAEPFNIGHIAIACGLAYIDFRFQSLEWRSHAGALAAWFETVESRECFKDTEPVDDEAALAILRRHGLKATP